MQDQSADQLLLNAKRVVLKFGSALVCAPDGTADINRLKGFTADIAAMMARGTEVIIVTSGAIALGRSVLGLSRALRLDEKQAAAAAGQTPLTMAWQNAFSDHLGDTSCSSNGHSTNPLSVAQILLTLDDTEDRKRYLNARTTIETLLSLGVIPLVNENDTIATTEIRYGDNDRLAAHTAQMLGADLLILLSDIDGLYTGNPNAQVDAQHIPVIKAITGEIEAYAQGPNEQAGVGSGGMVTKVAAARIATDCGCPVMIADGNLPDPVASIISGKAKTSLFLPSVKARTARQQWIAGRQKPTGTLQIDNGAKTALMEGASLLPAGVLTVTGSFQLGALVSVLDTKNQTIALGLVAYNSHEIKAIKGKKTEEIEAILGYRRRPSVIHRNDLIIASPDQ